MGENNEFVVGNTVKALIERLMPRGSFSPESVPSDARWGIVPRSPIDAFAVAATLVERSGAYRLVIKPDFDDGTRFRDLFALHELRSEEWRTIAEAWGNLFHPGLDKMSPAGIALREQVEAVFPDHDARWLEAYQKEYGQSYISGAQMADCDMSPLQDLWKDIVFPPGGNCEITAEEGNGELPPAWWGSAVRLMIVADMACRGVGFWPRQHAELNIGFSTIQSEVLERAGEAANSRRMLSTLTTDLVDPSYCAVLPKTRTSALGCTLRSITHHLALLPSPSLVQAHWRVPSVAPPKAARLVPLKPDAPERPLNLLLVPFPYRISAGSFRPSSQQAISLSDPGTATPPINNGWDYFSLDQLWLRKSGKLDGSDAAESSRAITDFVRGLLDKAVADMGEIHAIVFPEYALDKKTFDDLTRELFAHHSPLEHVIAGLSEEPGNASKHGNYAVIRGRPLDSNSEPHGTHARAKHHRWKIDKRQIERYGLSRNLDPSMNWWEAIPLGRRIVEFLSPRAGTCFTVMICEDLARADPVQTVIRSVGPNLVLALLMDGPQRRGRWPGHYAGVLADDPGSSVLTFTSLALVARGMSSDAQQSRSVGFFKDSTGSEHELVLPSEAQALALRLAARAKTEHSLDGRGDGNGAIIWELGEVSPVRVPLTDANRWIVEGST